MIDNIDNISTSITKNEQRIPKFPKNPDEINTIDDIIDDLRYLTVGFPEAAIDGALNKQHEITPILLNFLNEMIKNYESIEDIYFGHLHALYLLAKFREKNAFPLIIKIMSLPNDWPDNILGDTITEDLHRIVASVYNGDLASIYAIIENPNLCTWSRDAGLKTLLVLVREKILSRSDVIDYFKVLFDHPAFRDDYMATTHLINVSCDLYPDELKDKIQIAFDREMVDDFSVDMKWVKSVLSKTQDVVLSEFLTNKHYELIDNDAIKSMKYWACFSEQLERPVSSEFEYSKPEKASYDHTQIFPSYRTSPKIGRNDPCPCNSGKKYKKCCIQLH